MSDKIQRYLSGDFEYEGGSLIFSCSKIEISIAANGNVSGEFTIEEENGREFRGSVYSSNLSLEIMTQEFSGKSVTISYRTNIGDRLGGDVLNGEIYIISNRGEYVLPFLINITYENIQSSLGAIKNLFHFTNLAKCSWNEAVSLFGEKDFVRILSGNDRKYRSVYNGLVSQENANHNLEEFLVSIHKKQPVEFSLDREEIRLMNPDRSSMQSVRIHQSGWGYVYLLVKTNCDFITLERSILTENDFSENICEYQFLINEEALHEGNNYGQLIFEYNYGASVLNLTAVKRSKESNFNGEHLRKKAYYRITRSYLDLQLKHLSADTAISQMKDTLLHIRKLSSSTVEHVLMEAHLMLTQGNYNEAKWILDRGIENAEQLDDLCYCYYLYLTVLYSADEYYAAEVAEKVKSFCVKNPNDWRIAWIYFNLSPELHKNAYEKWNFGIEQLKRGCNSPVLYIDILKILNFNPALLNHIEDEYLRLLFYGAKNHFLSQELAMQLVSVANRSKEFHKLLLKILIMIYEENSDLSTLEAICILQMKGEQMDEKAHYYYGLAIENNLFITKLYEYFILSIDFSRKEKLPKSVLLYFSYDCELPAQHMAYIYLYIHQNRAKYVELYSLYRPQIERFIAKQLYANKMDSDLACLYQEILLEDMLTADNAAQFANLMFVNCITIERDDIVSVIVLDERLKEGVVYPVCNHKAYILLYGNEYSILLQDQQGKRFGSIKDYHIERFFLPRKLLSVIEPYAKENLPFSLFVCGGFQDSFHVTEQNVKHFAYLEQREELEDEYRYNIRMSLIQFYFEKDLTEALNELLERTEEEQIPFKYRADFVRLLSINGFTEKAYSLILAFGAENIEAKTIVRVCSSMTDTKELIYDRELLGVIYSAFERGKYNEILLSYLVNYYNGPVKKLCQIWTAASNFDVDSHAVCEKIMIQVMETGAFISEEKEIFDDYVNTAAKTEVVTSYLSYLCSDYMFFDRLLKEYVFKYIERFYLEENDIPEVCMVSYLRYFSEKVDSLSFDQKKIVRAFIRILYRERKMVLPFFAAYRSISVDAEILSHSLFLSYKGNPKSNVMVHYIIEREGEDEENYIKEAMKNMFGGIFVKEFVLFFGESVQYYITEEFGNKEQLTESGTLQNSDALPEETGSRYTMVNDIAMATTLKDYSAAKELIEEYAEKEFVVDALFSIQ